MPWSPGATPRLLVAPLVAGALAVGLVATGLASSQIGPDASAYLATASLVRHGQGFLYPDGSLILERPPLFALLVAFVGSWTPTLAGAAILVSRAGFVFLAMATAGLSARLAGLAGGVLAGVAFVLSGLFVDLSSSALIDGVQTSLAMASLVLWVSRPASGWKVAGLAGATLAVAFLVKEDAALWLLVPLATTVVDERPKVRALWAFLAGFVIVSGPWWIWVALQTGRVYLIGMSLTAFGLSAAGALALVAAAALARRRLALGPHVLLGWRPRAAMLAMLLLAWVWVASLGLSATADVDVNASAARSLVRYARTVLDPNLPLLQLGAVPLVIGLLLALREREARAVAITTICSLPLLPFVAQRGWDPRNLLLLLSPAVVLASFGAVRVIDWIAGHVPRSPVRRATLRNGLLAGVVGLSTAIAAADSIPKMELAQDRAVTTSWDQPAVAAVATWLAAHSAPGEVVLASWQFAAMFSVDASSQIWVRQLPLMHARANLAAAADPLVATATFDGWEDRRIPARPVGPILSAVQDPSGAISVLERSEVAAAITTSHARWLVLATGGPVLRDASGYETLPQIIGAGSPLMTANVGSTTIQVFAIPSDAPSRLRTATRVAVGMNARMATLLATDDPGVLRGWVDDLGIGSIRVIGTAAVSRGALTAWRAVDVAVSPAAP